MKLWRVLCNLSICINFVHVVVESFSTEGSKGLYYRLIIEINSWKLAL
jgi:hypothetical protein